MGNETKVQVVQRLIEDSNGRRLAGSGNRDEEGAVAFERLLSSVVEELRGRLTRSVML